MKYDPQERRAFENKGCGDPRCPMCYPENQQGFVSEGVNDMANSPVSIADIRNVWESIQRAESIPRTQPPINNLAKLREPIKDLILSTPHDLSWDSVVGNDAARQALMEVIEAPVKHADVYSFYNMKPAKGVVLWGPPGCGKTMFGKVCAAQVSKLYNKSAELLIINGMEIESPFIGVTEGKIAAIFAYAREYARVHSHPLTIFIDEADVLLPDRNRNAAKWQISTVASFLAELDGLKDNGAFVILATNRPEALDEALLRDGRCSRKIKVERPGFMEGREIIQNTLFNVPLSPSLKERGHGRIAVDVMNYFVEPKHIIAEVTALNTQTRETLDINLTLANIMNGAMLVGLVERAKAYAFRRDVASGKCEGLTLPDLLSAVDELVRENKGISHEFALREVMENLGAEKAEGKLN